ncbi:MULTISPECIES: SDR family oxidoreductase [Amycolatopsis]|uniref:Uncharacterized conserved protein YbjT, contains NAD(P)-binding and DUF2867 domains n=2 Tax=Amycolatopsis TaxID=1813 RepID=A0A1I4BMP3_9PSEU|nr:NmrA family NAD(P)-binding protein [Amycolatopsis sacchari]SFK69131.1 Uncharacterized conserved protein YbjT, contains NAD(P)-binding and DUF2867 domains [Amycolatopsis sacchari]
MILVATAGKAGTEAALLLASAGAGVRVLVRDVGRHEGLRIPGVELVVGDLRDSAIVKDAVTDADGVVLVSPAAPGEELGVVEATAAARVKHVVKLTHMGYTLLWSNAFMQNLLAMAPRTAQTDSFAASTGRGRVGLIDARDVAAVAARVMSDPGAHAGKTYWLRARSCCRTRTSPTSCPMCWAAGSPSHPGRMRRTSALSAQRVCRSRQPRTTLWRSS